MRRRRRTYPLEVVDDVGRVAAPKVRHRDADLLVVVIKVDADVLLQLLPAPQRGVNGILVNDPAVEQAVFWNLLRGQNSCALVGSVSGLWTAPEAEPT